jgi:hypothetical protein
MDTRILQTDCPDHCSDCGRCHDFQSRGIEWGNIAPKCLLDGLDDNDLAVPCQGDHDEG